MIIQSVTGHLLNIQSVPDYALNIQTVKVYLLKYATSKLKGLLDGGSRTDWCAVER